MGDFVADILGIWSLRSPKRRKVSVNGNFPIPSEPTKSTLGLKRRTGHRSLSADSVIKHPSNVPTPAWFKDIYDGAYDADRPKTPATLPRTNSRSRYPFYSKRPTLSTFDSVPCLRRTNSTISPDRFVATRRPGLSSTLNFHSNRDPRTLSNDEKLLRNKDASLDAFNLRRSTSSSMPSLNQPSTRRVLSVSRSGGGGASVLTFRQDPADGEGARQVSVGTVWTVGGLAPASTGVPDGRGGLLGSGTNAPLYTTSFAASKPKAKEDMDLHEGRIAEALELDRAGRVLEFRDATISRTSPTRRSQCQKTEAERKTLWQGTEWILGGPDRILDAPNLRDDFYCSILAYSPTCHTLAVGLGSLLYAWSEKQGVHLLNSGVSNGSWLTSLGFSSSQGQKSILAFGRSDGTLRLMSLYDSTIPRFEVRQPCPVACLTWRPNVAIRPSRYPHSGGAATKTEDLVVGDEIGNVYYYAVEWPEAWEVARTNWSGSMTLLVRISTHTQQICGLSFSCDGSMFATGGNDNLCCLFQTSAVLKSAEEDSDNNPEVVRSADVVRRIHQVGGSNGIKEIRTGAEKHRWHHGAAVKAIAFCPWRDGLVATGGGSNDKCIHFFHTTSGACLATISVAAQVTSLIWSNTRREIVATFGYAQPDHPYRIAVFSWPGCKQVAAIPWEGEHRALYAIPYPGGPNESSNSREGGHGMTRTAAEGCIVVAASDESVKFHEVWTSVKKATTGGEGLLGGSDILEGLEGMDREGEVIR